MPSSKFCSEKECPLEWPFGSSFSKNEFKKKKTLRYQISGWLQSIITLIFFKAPLQDYYCHLDKSSFLNTSYPKRERQNRCWTVVIIHNIHVHESNMKLLHIFSHFYAWVHINFFTNFYPTSRKISGVEIKKSK